MWRNTAANQSHHVAKKRHSGVNSRLVALIYNASEKANVAETEPMFKVSK